MRPEPEARHMFAVREHLHVPALALSGLCAIQTGMSHQRLRPVEHVCGERHHTASDLGLVGPGGQPGLLALCHAWCDVRVPVKAEPPLR